MRWFLFYYCVFILISDALPQDVLYKKTGEKFSVKVIEITKDVIIYKPPEDMDGPVRSIPAYQVYMIKYEDGREERLQILSPLSKNKDELYYLYKKNHYYISFAPGFGQSYGCIGLRLQGRIGKILGFGYHGGVGYFPELNGFKAAIWFSVGAKFFFYKAWYLNLQFGSVAQYKLPDISGQYQSYKYGTVYGPSFLIGGDWFFDDNFGMNAAVGCAINATQAEIKENAYPTIDIGFIMKF